MICYWLILQDRFTPTKLSYEKYQRLYIKKMTNIIKEDLI
jgi:hypothetical protein